MKKPVLLILMILIAALIVAACSKTKSQTALKKLNLNEVVHSIFYAPQYAAMELGYFEENGLEINLSVGQGADKSMVALISGDADIALLGTEAALYVYNEGKENYAMGIAQLTQKAGNFLVAREQADDFQWSDIKGKTVIGGRAGGMPQMILEYVMKQNGIDPQNDIDMVQNLQFTSTAGAFAGGVGDYTAEFDPTARSLELAGTGYVVASLGEESGNVPYTVYMATQDYIKNNGDTIQGFVNAIYKGQIYVDTHSAEEIAALIAPYFKESSINELAFMIDRYKEQGTWKNVPTFDEESFYRIQDIMQASNELDKRVPYEEIIDNRFAEKAIAGK